MLTSTTYVLCASNRRFENQTYEIWSHFCEKASKGRFCLTRYISISSKITVTREKEKEKKKERGEERDLEKGNGCTLSFYITLEILFGQNK